MKKKDEKWFDHRLKEIGRNKSDLARYLGVDRAVVTRLISGDQRVTVEHVEKMCLFLEASPTKVLAACGVDFGTNKNKTWLADASDDDDRRKSRISIKDGDDGIEWSVPEYLRQEVGISDPAKCCMVRAVDDNMRPTVDRGDHVMVDMSQQEAAAGVFLLRHAGGRTLRRLDPVIGSTKVRVSSDLNGEGRDLPAKDIDIVGRVIWRAGRV